MQPEPIQDEHDDDSLFGSPPPSPQRGRSPSPLLALPSLVPQSLSCGSEQNVGTIALPGSHAHSEPVNPLALALSLPGSSCTPVLPQSLPSSSKHSTSKTQRPAPPQRKSTQTQGRKKTSKAKSKSKESTPRPQGPEIPLPDPSQPLPAHFLRNQQALLGHAGLIAGVKPSKLVPRGTPRGASPSNPIVVDDFDNHLITVEPPVIGKAKNTNYFRKLDPSKLPTPTNQEIVEMLIKQKDIFPVLGSILKLLATGALGGNAAVGWKRPYSDAPKAPHPKKRKLNRVPAGAADWDVPYPFEEGEGPEAYRQTWVKDRGRQLISQLITLVKIAAKKAAAKKHVIELEEKKQREREAWIEEQGGDSSVFEKSGRVGKHHRVKWHSIATPSGTLLVERDDVEQGNKGPDVIDLTEQGDDQMSQPIVVPESSRSPSQTTTSASPEPSQNTGDRAEVVPLQPLQQSANPVTSSTPFITPFDQLISTLLAASSDPNSNHLAFSNDLSSSASLDLLTTNTPPISPASASFTDPTSFDFTSGSDGQTDQALVDSWMNILQTFPLQSNGTSPDAPGYFDSLFISTSSDASTFASPLTGDSSSFSTTPNPDPHQPQTFPSLNVNQPGASDFTLDFETTGLSTDPMDPMETSESAMPVDFSFSSTDMQNGQLCTGGPLKSSDVDHLGVTDPTEAPGSGQQTQKIDDHLIDPALLALSLSQLDGPDRASPAAHPFPSISPLSTHNPATPSSVSRDVCTPGVALEEVHLQGLPNHVNLTQAQAQKPHEQSATNQHSSEAASDEISVKSIKRNQNQHEDIVEPSLQPHPPHLSARPSPTPSTPLFQVLRATDLEPRESVRSLQKSEVLKKAEEKRKLLQQQLDLVKVKLWETTIEHGALMHVARMCSEIEQAGSRTA